MDLLKKIQIEEDLKRQERIAKNSNYLISQAKLPPRMEMHEQEKQNGRLRAEELALRFNKNQYQPYERERVPKVRPVPDFEKKQRQFYLMLEKKKSNNRCTEPEPFNFHPAHENKETR